VQIAPSGKKGVYAMTQLRIGQKILFSLLGVAVFSMVIFSSLILYSTADILKSNTTREIKELIARSAESLEGLVQQSKMTLSIIAKSPMIQELVCALESGGQEDLQKALARVEAGFMGFQTQDETIQAIRFIDFRGYVLAKVKEGNIIPRKGAKIPGLGLHAVSSKKGRDFFKSTMRLKRGQVWISNLERGWMEGAENWCPAMVRFSTPLFSSDGTRAGMVIINVWGKATGEMINRLISPDEGTAFLIEKNLEDDRRNGIYLFHQNSACEFGNQTGSNITVFQEYPKSVTDSWMHQAAGISIHPVSKDILAHHFLSPYPNDQRGWVVVVNARRGFFMGPLAAIKTRVLLFAGLVLGLTLLAAFFLSRSLIKPIQAVVDGTRRIGEDLSNRIPISAKDEIGSLAEEINQMASSLQRNLEERKRIEEKIHQSERLASIGQMASGVAHELNTPLSNIRALSVLARKDLEKGKIDKGAILADFLDISKQVEKCTLIISGLLSFARPQSPKLKILNINDLVKETLSLVRIKSEKKGVEIRFEEDPHLPHLRIDGHQTQQVFVNILLNAIDAVEKGGKILIRSEAGNGTVSIKFKDNGEGIRPEHFKSIFDPFFTTKEVGRGTGLGLFVSYGIIKNHGGTIEVESKRGKGSLFKVALPTGDIENDENIGRR
jgi:two-component system NtrC family sensor kinase